MSDSQRRTFATAVAETVGVDRLDPFVNIRAGIYRFEGLELIFVGESMRSVIVRVGWGAFILFASKDGTKVHVLIMDEFTTHSNLKDAMTYARLKIGSRAKT